MRFSVSARPFHHRRPSHQKSWRDCERARSASRKHSIFSSSTNAGCSLAIFCFNSSFGSLPAFIPTIVKEMGFTSVHAQGLYAPPYLAAYICCIVLAFFSGRIRNRDLLITVYAWIDGTGYLFFRLSERTSTRYAAIYLITCGVFPCIGLTSSWVTDNQMTSNKRGTGLALFGMLG